MVVQSPKLQRLSYLKGIKIALFFVTYNYCHCLKGISKHKFYIDLFYLPQGHQLHQKIVGRIILRRSGNTWQQVNQWTKRRLSIVISRNLHCGFHWLTRGTMSLHLIFKILCLTLLKEKLKTMNPTKITRMSAAKLSVCFDMVTSKNWKSLGMTMRWYIFDVIAYLK